MIEEKEDFFEQEPIEKPKKVKPPKKPRYKEDDPRYYDREEGKWDHLMPSPYRRGPVLWIVGIAVVVMLFCIGIYKYLFSPVIDDAVEYGYVENVQKEGSFFHTFEGVILPYKPLMDTLRPYEGDFVFSARDESVATSLKMQQGRGKPVKVHYKVYRHQFPWRGKSKVVVTAVDTVEPSIILPPDRRPEYLGRPAPAQPEEKSDQK